ncbi:MAG: glycosyltransferase family 4 protein [Candidatus Aminicenantes bacterium]|nr:MAG: glycosyltransferase family 4 protein [Candidatus Aminicenantes bacterium]
MKVAVDCYEVVEYSTGVGRVIDNILISLIDILPEFSFFVFTREHIKKYSDKNVNQSVIPSPKGYFRWQNGPFIKKLKDIEPDLLIAPNYTIPFFNRWKSIVIEHDISFVTHPEWFSKKEAVMKKYLVKRSLKKSTSILTVSEFSKNEIIKNFDINPEKIKVFLHGVEDRFKRRSENEINEWKEQKGLKNTKIIGYLGSIFNRRNIPLLVESVNRIREELPDTILYVIGKDLTHPPQNISKLLNKDWIKWDAVIDDAELSLFYSSIDAFAYLSEYEGFGLPPLEVLACGTVPVLLNKTSLKEIYKDMAIMVDVPDVHKIKEALMTAIKDEERKEAVLSRFSEKRPQFSWPKIAKEFSLLIESLLP